jgi:D-aspartate ligase
VRAPGAIVIGGYINGLGLVRSLAAQKIPTAVITTEPFDVAHHSRHVTGWEAAPGLQCQPDLLPELLERRCSEWAGRALIPANDEALAAVAHHDELLARNHTVISPPQELARVFLNKRTMREAAEAVGIDLPRCYGTPSDGMAVTFPVIVKPLSGHAFQTRFGCKLFLAENETELRTATEKVREAGIECEVYDLIPGRDDCIYVYCTYIDGRGEPADGLTVHKLRQSPPRFGVARVAEVVKDIPALREATVELARHLGFRGMAAVEFKRDPRDGSYRFMEINGRSVIYNALLRRAGLDLAALAWADYVHESPAKAAPNGWPGVWMNLHADVLYSALKGRRESLTFREFLAPYRRPHMDAVWERDDPRPFFSQWGRTALEALSRKQR